MEKYCVACKENTPHYHSNSNLYCDACGRNDKLAQLIVNKSKAGQKPIKLIKNNKILSAIILCLIGFVIAKYAVLSTIPSAMTSQETVLATLNNAATAVNKQGPRMVDTSTRMDRASVGPGARLTYFYSLPNYSSRNVDPNSIRSTMDSIVKSEACKEKEMLTILNNGATFLYVYSGNDGIEILRIEVNKNTCIS